MKIKLNTKFFLLFAILLFPSLIYVVLSTGKHEIIKLPYYGHRSIADSSNSSESAFIPVKLKDKAIEAETEIENKITLVHIGLESDIQASARIFGILNEIANKFKGKNDFLILSVLDSNYINTNEYKQANKNLNLNKQIWYAAFVDEPVLKNLSLELAIKNSEAWNNRNDSSVTEPILCLLDKKGYIRAYFDGTKYTENSAIVDAMKIIKAEEFLSKKNKKNE